MASVSKAITRIDRARRPLHLETTRLKRAPRPATDELRSFEERIALFAVAYSKESAGELLEGLAERGRLRARETARSLLELDSAARQAKVAVVFGLRPDAAPRLGHLLGEAGPLLQQEMYRLLPPYLKTLFPRLADADTEPGEAACAALKALAVRWVREATR